MADTKITALTAIGANPIIPSTFPIPMVDLTDTSMAASGTTKKVTVNQILQAGGTATLASATITGDLTVDTNTLKVDSANNRVGIGTASPTVPLYVTGNNATATAIMQDETNGAKLRLLANSINFDLSNGGGGGGISVSGNNPIIFQTNGSEQMRLNSTGLGVGASPNQKFVCAGPRSYFAGGGAVYGIGIGFNTTRTAADHVFFLGATDSATPDLVFSGASGAALMRLDATGNLGIGVTPSAGGSIYYKTLEIGKAGCGLFAATTPLSSSEFTYLSGNGVLAYNSGPEWKYGNNGAVAIYGIEDGVHKWYNATTGTAGVVFTPTQAMTLDASGNLLVGTTTAGAKITALAGASGQAAIFQQPAQNFWCVLAHNQATSGDNSFVLFGTEASFTSRGSITYNRAAGQVSYNITSDYRLKEDVKPLTGALNRISSLKPSTYKFKETGFTCEGFIAHELAEVIPAAVTGEKDAVNEDGSIKAQGVDLSKVVPILVAAIQELAARVQTLETR